MHNTKVKMQWFKNFNGLIEGLITGLITNTSLRPLMTLLFYSAQRLDLFARFVKLSRLLVGSNAL